MHNQPRRRLLVRVHELLRADLAQIGPGRSASDQKRAGDDAEFRPKRRGHGLPVLEFGRHRRRAAEVPLISDRRRLVLCRA